MLEQLDGRHGLGSAQAASSGHPWDCVRVASSDDTGMLRFRKQVTQHQPRGSTCTAGVRILHPPGIAADLETARRACRIGVGDTCGQMTTG